MSNHPHRADRLAIKVATALRTIRQQHPEAARDIEDLLLAVPELRGVQQTARLIAEAPTDDPEHALLLFCPEQGGWQTGVFHDGQWLDFATLSSPLTKW